MNTYPMSNGDPGDPEPFDPMTGPMPLTQPTEGCCPTDGAAGSDLRDIMCKLAAEHAATPDGEMDLLWGRLRAVSATFEKASADLDKITDSVLAIQYRMRGEKS